LLAGAVINARVLNPARPSVRLRWRQRLILQRMGSPRPPVVAPTPSDGHRLIDAPDVVVPLDPEALFPARPDNPEPEDPTVDDPTLVP
jgi:hypothetical protein